MCVRWTGHCLFTRKLMSNFSSFPHEDPSTDDASLVQPGSCGKPNKRWAERSLSLFTISCRNQGLDRDKVSYTHRDTQVGIYLPHSTCHPVLVGFVLHFSPCNKLSSPESICNHHHFTWWGLLKSRQRLLLQEWVRVCVSMSMHNPASWGRERITHEDKTCGIFFLLLSCPSLYSEYSIPSAWWSVLFARQQTEERLFSHIASLDSLLSFPLSSSRVAGEHKSTAQDEWGRKGWMEDRRRMVRMERANRQTDMNFRVLPLDLLTTTTTMLFFFLLYYSCTKTACKQSTQGFCQVETEIAGG